MKAPAPDLLRARKPAKQGHPPGALPITAQESFKSVFQLSVGLRHPPLFVRAQEFLEPGPKAPYIPLRQIGSFVTGGLTPGRFFAGSATDDRFRTQALFFMKYSMHPPAFIPATRKEALALGWKYFDVILVSGDTYIDAPHIGVAVIGRVLLDAGYRVGIIAQPDIDSDRDIARLGEPALFWGVTAGCVDSMIANYTASGKRRKSDDMTPGGQNTKRPDRAVIVYSNLIRRRFKQTRAHRYGRHRSQPEAHFPL